MPQISRDKIDRYIDALYTRYKAIREELRCTERYLAEVLDGYLDRDIEAMEDWMDVVIADPVFVKFCAHRKAVGKEKETSEFDLWTIKNGMGVIPDSMEIEGIIAFLGECKNYSEDAEYSLPEDAAKEEEKKADESIGIVESVLPKLPFHLHSEKELTKPATNVDDSKVTGNPVKKEIPENKPNLNLLSAKELDKEDSVDDPRIRLKIFSAEQIKEVLLANDNIAMTAREIYDIAQSGSKYDYYSLNANNISSNLCNNADGKGKNVFHKVSPGKYAVIVTPVSGSRKDLEKPKKKRDDDFDIEPPPILAGKKKAAPIEFSRPELKAEALLPPPTKKEFHKNEPELKPLEIRAAAIMAQHNEDEKKFNEWCEKNDYGFVSETDKRFPNLLQQYYDELEGWIEPKKEKGEVLTPFDNEKGDFDEAFDEEFVDVESIRSSY